MNILSRRRLPFVGIALVAIVGTALILAKEPPVPSDPHLHGSHEEHADHDSDEHGHEEHGEHGEELASLEHASVIMSDDAMKASGIEIMTAGIAEMAVGVELPGEVAYDQDRIAHVSTRIRGTVRESRVHLGDRVRPGQLLAVLDAPELADIRRRCLAAASRSELAKASMVREEKLLSRKISPERHYLEARQAYEESLIDLRGVKAELFALGLEESDLNAPSLSYYPLRSPIAGIVAEKHAVIGEVIEPERDAAEQASFVIADLSTVWIEMALPPRLLHQARIGQKVMVTSPDLEESLIGRIAHVAAAMGEKTHSAEAHAEVVNPGLRWRPGLFVNVILVEEEVTVPVAIRASGLQTLKDRAVVFVREGEVFEVREVELGRKSGDWVEILSGVKAGETYAAANSFIVKAEIGKGEAAHDH